MDQKRAFEIVKEYLAYLKENKYNIQKAYIFGSYAKGNFHEDSDIDLAIVLENLSNSFTMQIQLMKLSRKFDSRIEPHPLDADSFDQSNPFAYEILSKGIEVV
jgi:uncharacterized protein